MTSRNLRLATGIALIILGLLFMSGCPAWAQDETLEPDATSAETNSDCTTSNAHTRLSDNLDGTLCDGGDGSGSESYIIRLDFPTPASAPDETTDAQEWQCRMAKSSAGGNGDPTFTMELWCNDALVEAGGIHTATSDTISEFSETFTWTSASCASDGADTELHLNIVRQGGSPAGRRSVDSVDCDWDVTWAAGTEELMVIGDRQHEEASPHRLPAAVLDSGSRANRVR